MKIIICQQNTPEWETARLGIPTASEFSRIVTAVKGDLSASAGKYAAALVAETLLRRPLLKSPFSSMAMERGKTLEPLAAQQYEFENDIETTRAGFATTDDGRWGCSPDRLIVGTKAGVEIKCTLDEQHMSIFGEGPGTDYKQQVQGSLLISDFEWWDLYAYHDELPPATIRTYRDEPYIAKMRSALNQFCEIRDKMLEKAIATGYFQERLKAAA